MSNGTAEWLGTGIMVIFALTLVFVRLRGSRKPVSAKAIIMPPIGMSTGFLMFLAPATHDKLLYAVLALAAGVMLSYPLIVTSRLHIVRKDIYLKRSKGYIFILLGLLILRTILHQYVEQYVSIMQTASLFFILAFGMILPWRVAMLLNYRRLSRQLASESESDASVSEGSKKALQMV